MVLFSGVYNIIIAWRLAAPGEWEAWLGPYGVKTLLNGTWIERGTRCQIMFPALEVWVLSAGMVESSSGARTEPNLPI